MKKPYIFLIAIFMLNIAHSQDWKWLNPLPQGNPLYCVQFVNPNTGFAVGAGGSILKTINGGTNWTVQISGTTNALWSVYFTDANTGYAVGYGSTILKTTNGGTNWTGQPSMTAFELYDVYFTNANTGYAVGMGGAILQTTNGGGAWIADKNYEMADILVYPNPAKDKITIDLQKVFDFRNSIISIYSIKGQLLEHKRLIQGETELNISDFTQGVYVVGVYYGNDTFVSKFIKE